MHTDHVVNDVASARCSPHPTSRALFILRTLADGDSVAPLAACTARATQTGQVLCVEMVVARDRRMRHAMELVIGWRARAAAQCGDVTLRTQLAPRL